MLQQRLRLADKLDELEGVVEPLLTHCLLDLANRIGIDPTETAPLEGAVDFDQARYRIPLTLLALASLRRLMFGANPRPRDAAGELCYLG